MSIGSPYVNPSATGTIAGGGGYGTTPQAYQQALPSGQLTQEQLQEIESRKAQIDGLKDTQQQSLVMEILLLPVSQREQKVAQLQQSGALKPEALLVLNIENMKEINKSISLMNKMVQATSKTSEAIKQGAKLGNKGASAGSSGTTTALKEIDTAKMEEMLQTMKNSKGAMITPEEAKELNLTPQQTEQFLQYMLAKKHSLESSFKTDVKQLTQQQQLAIIQYIQQNPNRPVPQSLLNPNASSSTIFDMTTSYPMGKVQYSGITPTPTPTTGTPTATLQSPLSSVSGLPMGRVTDNS